MEQAPIEVKHLFPLVDRKLIQLLRQLSPSEWQLPTLAKKWCVKDVAAHLLDGNIRVIAAMHQHSPPPPPPLPAYNDLVHYLNNINAEWVVAMKRVSPEQLVDWLEDTGQKYCEYMQSQPLFEKAPYSVAWAGESESMNWFHIAREYTEKMHHQLQIRNALGCEEPLLSARFFHPFIATFMYGLPHALARTPAKDGTTIRVEISSESGGNWYVENLSKRWQLTANPQAPPAASLVLSPTIAWKLFTKGLDPDSAFSQVTCEGDERLCKAVMKMVAVMA
jgi:uncharacterized protein (TIGR03083 family)